jgi:hypothetical protein
MQALSASRSVRWVTTPRMSTWSETMSRCFTSSMYAPMLPVSSTRKTRCSSPMLFCVAYASASAEYASVSTGAASP